MHFSSVDPFVAALAPSSCSSRSSSIGRCDTATETDNYVEPSEPWNKIYCGSNCSMYSSASSHESGISSNDPCRVFRASDAQIGASKRNRGLCPHLQHSQVSLSSTMHSVVTQEGTQGHAQQQRVQHAPVGKRKPIREWVTGVSSHIVSFSRSPLLVLLLLILLLVQEQQLRLLYTRGCASIEALNSCSSRDNRSSKELSMRTMQVPKRAMPFARISKPSDGSHISWVDYFIYSFAPPQLLRQHEALDSWDLEYECLMLYTLSWAAVAVASGLLLTRLSSLVFSVFHKADPTCPLQEPRHHTRRLSSHTMTSSSLAPFLANPTQYTAESSSITESIGIQDTGSFPSGSCAVPEGSAFFDSEGTTHILNGSALTGTIPSCLQQEENIHQNEWKQGLRMHDRIQRRVRTTKGEDPNKGQNCIGGGKDCSCRSVTCWRTATTNVTGKGCPPVAGWGSSLTTSAGAVMPSRVHRCLYHSACKGSDLYSDSAKRRFSGGALGARCHPLISADGPRQRHRVRYFYIGDSKDSAVSESYSSSDDSGTTRKGSSRCPHSRTRKGSSVG